MIKNDVCRKKPCNTVDENVDESVNVERQSLAMLANNRPSTRQQRGQDLPSRILPLRLELMPHLCPLILRDRVQLRLASYRRAPEHRARLRALNNSDNDFDDDDDDSDNEGSRGSTAQYSFAREQPADTCQTHVLKIPAPRLVVKESLRPNKTIRKKTNFDDVLDDGKYY